MEAAGREARAGGCPQDLWMNLARHREKRRPILTEVTAPCPGEAVAPSVLDERLVVFPCRTPQVSEVTANRGWPIVCAVQARQMAAATGKANGAWAKWQGQTARGGDKG